jgi:hypothetical protein
MLEDEDGDFSDWIELYNPGDDPVNLEGWGLSDDEEEPMNWTFPEVTLAPGEYLIVWASNKNRKPDIQAPGQGITREVYLEIPGSSVDDLLSSPGFPAKPDSETIVTTVFEAPSNIDDNYGQRMHGLLKAPQTGYYVFWIAGDDNSRLYLSSDDSHQNARLIAEVPEWTNSREWGKYNEQKSEEIHLVEGEYYYISALMKEASGGDNLAVRWQLPDGSTETPMEASHIYTPDKELHTNFAISADGETLSLSNPDGEIIHYIEPVELPSDISWGIVNDSDQEAYFEQPTPGEANTTAGYSEIITQKPQFSHSSGFYSNSFELSFTADDPEAEIYYTLDGSEPSVGNIEEDEYQYINSYPGENFLSRASKTFKYEEPITIRNTNEEPYELATINTRFSSSTQLPEDNIFKGTVVRAKIVKPDAISPTSETHTYFVTPDGTSRYNLPVVAITTDEEHLFDYEHGIYVPGKVANNWYSEHPGEEWNDGRPANYNQRGETWEKAAHFEYFNEDMQPVFEQNIGIRIHGGWTRAYNMKSLRLYARNSYDDDNTLRYPFFEELPSRGDPAQSVTEFRRLILRNSGNDNYSTMYRDALMQELVKHLPVAIQAWQPVVHFINGEYWGIINLRERYDEDYIAAHYHMNPDDVVILEAWGNVDEGVPDDSEQFFSIVDYAERNNLNDEQHYRWVKERVDLENLAHYYAIQFYIYNDDWPQNNMKFWRKRTSDFYINAPGGHDGKWRWMLYDTDFGMNLYGSHNHTLNAIERVTNGSATDPTSRLFRQLLKNDEFKNRFINIMADHLNTCFNPGYIHEKINAFNEMLSPYRDEHWNRWKSGTDTGQSMKTFATYRPGYMKNHINTEFDLDGNVSLTVSKEGDGGLVMVNSILINEELPGLSNISSPYPWEGDYFKNTPLKVKAVDTPGYRFSHWEGIGYPSALDREVKLDMTENTEIKAVFEEASKELLHYWHFNNLPDGELGPQSASQSITEEAAVLSYEGNSEGYMDRVNDGTEINVSDETNAGRALRVRNPADTRALLLSLPTTDYQEIVLKYAVKRTKNGARVEDILFRTEKSGAWLPIRENLQITEEYQLIEADFSEYPEVNNNPYFEVKIIFPHESASGNSGNNRFDNISLEGYPARDTSSNDIENDERVEVFPVPATDDLNFRAKNKIILINFFDASGKKAMSLKPESFTHKTSVSGLNRGLYFVEIHTSGETVTRKIIVQ